MRTEVKRSLLWWPIAASVTITALTWFPCLNGPSSQLLRFAGVQAESQILDVVSLYAKSRLRISDIELSARSERGARAMRMPDRVAEVFGVTQDILEAPVRNEQQELAGLVLEKTDVSLDVAGNAFPHPTADATEAELVLSAPIHLLGNLRNRDHLSMKKTGQPPSQCTPPSLLGPVDSQSPSIRSVFEEITGEPLSMIPQSIQALGKRILSSQAAAQDATQVELPVESPSVTIRVEKSDDLPRHVTQRSPAGWPVTQQLDRQLVALAESVNNLTPGKPSRRDQLVSSVTIDRSIEQWSADVSGRLDQLRRLPRLGDPRAGDLIDQLSELADEGSSRAEQLRDRQLQIQWLRAAYAVARRVAVWRPVWEVSRDHEPTWMVSDDRTATPESIRQMIEAIRLDLESTGDGDGWNRYLLLDEISRASESGEQHPRTVLAQRFLSRLTWHGLDVEQQRWLDRESINSLASMIRPWTRKATDYANLMTHLERQESNSIDLAAIDIAGAVQSLRFAENPKAVRVAEAIDVHYRNANVRLALSQPMLQRMMPSIDPQSIPIRTKMFGSRVRGMSRVESDLRIQLVPSPDRWTMHLNTIGNVRTQSTGFSGPVAVRTSGNSNFVAATPIEVTPRGVQLGGSEVDVNGRTRLRSIRTDYDGWPLIGSLVKSIAASRYESVAPRSHRAANHKIESEVGAEINTQLDQRVGVATDQLSEMVLGPLAKMRLDPKVSDMQTTESRLLARYRLAGDWQIGAYTPRPRAPSTSLMSVQVHQSALNNTLEQLIPRDRTLSIREMIQVCAETFGQDEIAVPDDIPEDVTVRFANTRPITVEIEEGGLWVTLRILSLQRGDRVDLTRFIVRAAYKPQLNGMQAVLVRDGHLRISGPGMSMRERLPVRAIFNKVLSSNRPLPLTMPPIVDHPATQGLAVSQLELRSGWIAMAISESDAPRIALIETQDPKSPRAKR